MLCKVSVRSGGSPSACASAALLRFSSAPPFPRSPPHRRRRRCSPAILTQHSSLLYAALDPTWKTQIPVSNTWETFSPATHGACAPLPALYTHTHTHTLRHTHRTHGHTHTDIPHPPPGTAAGPALLCIFIVPPPLTHVWGGKAAGMRS